MALYVAPSPTRPDPVLHPSYFTSSLYTESLRNDIKLLTSTFRTRFLQDTAKPAFPLFKDIWSSHGWKWIHLRVLNDKSRERSQHVTCRLLIENIVQSEDALTQAAALFALYSFYNTQPNDTTPSLWQLSYIPITTDDLIHIYSLPERLQAPNLRSARLSVLYILRQMDIKQTFLLLPESRTSPHSPTNLPRERYVPQGDVLLSEAPVAKKRGRPTKNEKTKRLRAHIGDLDGWLDQTEQLVETSSGATTLNPLDDYKRSKLALLSLIDPPDAGLSEGQVVIANANAQVLDRLKEARTLLSDGDTTMVPRDGTGGIERVENALQDMARGSGRGVLSLLDGSGQR
ncbi:hypothetical protein FA15DRAFT_32833 [Coprinopsis marcescibilis]|uniref:Uncharacterized protein n=1 Tax=Coprinopsis marcescibilis TaxID=230819 RepID=A0A5C3LDT4_COPMA|nr:hypothetical protein FA15DRAFT_32833 [Coprinopsis marcescibilis]